MSSAFKRGLLQECSLILQKEMVFSLVASDIYGAQIISAIRGYSKLIELMAAVAKLTSAKESLAEV